MPSKRTKTKLKKARSATALTRKQTPRSPSPGAIGQLIRGLGALGGGALGGLIGQPAAGSSAGSSLGAAFSRWLGAGDYRVSTNSLVAKAAQGIPMMHNSGQSVTIRHKEYLGQVTSSINFSVRNTFPINPGMSTTFPWLSRIAGAFQQYEMKGMVYHYIPTSGSISTTQALGSVMIQTGYRANDTPPKSKVEILNEYWANETVPFETMAHPVECDPKENPFNVHYVRNGPIPGGEIAMYDIGATYVATSGQSTDGTVLGDLWVTYEVELKKPIIDSNTTSLSSFYSVVMKPPSSNTSLFSGGERFSATGNLAVEYSTTSNTVTLPAGCYGEYYIFMYATGSLGSPSNWPGGYGTPGSNLAFMPIDGYNLSWATASLSSNSITWAAKVVVKEPTVASSFTCTTPAYSNAPLAVSMIIVGP